MGDNYCVYKHTGPTGLVYIGITRQKPEARWKNGKGYIECPKFYHAIQKYGWSAFSHEILASGLSETEAKAMEIDYIALYRSNEQGHGYNISAGGDLASCCEESNEKRSESVKTLWSDDEFRARAVSGMAGKTRSDAARQNISAAQKRRFEDPQERALVGLRQIGKTRSEEAKKKTSESLRAYYKDPEHIKALKEAHAKPNRDRLARPVLCIETGEVFAAVIDASKAMGITHQNIIKVCQGQRPRAGGYSWKYVGPEGGK